MHSCQYPSSQVLGQACIIEIGVSKDFLLFFIIYFTYFMSSSPKKIRIIIICSIWGDICLSQFCRSEENCPLLKTGSSQVWPLAIFNLLHICPRPFCWSYFKSFGHDTTSNKTKDTGVRQPVKFMPHVWITVQCIWKKKPSWTQTIDSSFVLKMSKLIS